MSKKQTITPHRNFRRALARLTRAKANLADAMLLIGDAVGDDADGFGCKAALRAVRSCHEGVAAGLRGLRADYPEVETTSPGGEA